MRTYYKLIIDVDDDVELGEDISPVYYMKRPNATRVMALLITIKSNSKPKPYKTLHFEDWIDTIDQSLELIKEFGMEPFIVGGNRSIELEECHYPDEYEWDD